MPAPRLLGSALQLLEPSVCPDKETAELEADVASFLPMETRGFTVKPKKVTRSMVWWHTPIIPAHRRGQQEVTEFQGSLNYIA